MFVEWTDTSSIKSFIFLPDLSVSGPMFPQGSACSSKGDYKTNQMPNVMFLVNSQEGFFTPNPTYSCGLSTVGLRFV